MSLTRNITITLILLSLTQITYAWPATPSGEVNGWKFSDYFNNISWGCSNPGEWPKWFNPGTNYMPTCFSIDPTINNYLATNVPDGDPIHIGPNYYIRWFNASGDPQYLPLPTLNVGANGLGTYNGNPIQFSTWTKIGNDIYNNNTQNVGIGASPGLFKLDVTWNMRVSTDSFINWVRIGVWNKQSTSNTALGYLTLSANTNLNNTAVWAQALEKNTWGSNNTAMWPQALGNNLGWNDNTAIGSNALLSNITGTGNVWVWKLALKSNTNTSYNTAVGTMALNNNIASNNTAVGYQSLTNNTSWTSNVAIWTQALFNSSANNNTAIGYQSLYKNTNSDNTAIGYQSLFNNNNAQSNTAIGYQSLYSNILAIENTAVGRQALYTSNANYNTAIGNWALQLSTWLSNTALWHNAGSTQISWNNNIMIGASANVNTSTASNQLSIGNSIYGNNIGTPSANIGINKNNPTVALDVVGNTNITSSLNVGSNVTIVGTTNTNWMINATAGINTNPSASNTLNGINTLHAAFFPNTLNGYTLWNSLTSSTGNNALSSTSGNNTLTATLGDNVFTAGSENKFTALAWSGNVFLGIGNIFYSLSTFNNSTIFNSTVTFNSTVNLNAITATTGNFTTSLTSPSGIFTTTLSSPTATFSTSISTPSATITNSIVNSLRMTWTTPWPWQVLTSINASWDASWENGIQRGTICTLAKPMIGIAPNGNIICAP
jgi:hypothetical protein